MKRAGFWRSFRAKPRLQKGAGRGCRNKAGFCALRVVAHGKGQRIGAGAPLLVRAGVAARACRPKPAKAARARPDKPASSVRFCCKNRSGFKGPKTPPSHGLTGLAAIKPGAKKRAPVFIAARCARWRAQLAGGWRARG